MPTKRGRPPMQGIGVWRHPDVLSRRVSTILSHRDPDDEESITDAVYEVRALAHRVGAQLSSPRSRQLASMTAVSEPSEVLRLLLSWRFRLPDRTVRRLQARTDIAEMRWA
jgi:hypothetical protein